MSVSCAILFYTWCIHNSWLCATPSRCIFHWIIPLGDGGKKWGVEVRHVPIGQPRGSTLYEENNELGQDTENQNAASLWLQPAWPHHPPPAADGRGDRGGRCYLVTTTPLDPLHLPACQHHYQQWCRGEGKGRSRHARRRRKGKSRFTTWNQRPLPHTEWPRGQANMW